MYQLNIAADQKLGSNLKGIFLTRFYKKQQLTWQFFCQLDVMANQKIRSNSFFVCGVHLHAISKNKGV